MLAGVQSHMADCKAYLIAKLCRQSEEASRGVVVLPLSSVFFEPATMLAILLTSFDCRDLLFFHAACIDRFAPGARDEYTVKLARLV